HPRLAHRLQIRAGAERAVRSGEDGDVERLVCLEATERVRERRGRRTVDGVGDLGAVDRDDGDGTLAAKPYAHDVPSDPTVRFTRLFRQPVALIWLRSEGTEARMAHTVF